MEEEKKETTHKSSDYLYLEKLIFRPELRKSFFNFFVTKFRVVILLIALISFWGIYSFIKLPLESNPEVRIPIAVVITAYPGASPADVEELVTKKIETKISGLKDLDSLTSSSANSVSSITVEFNAKANLDDSIRKLQDSVNNIKSDLPDDASEPIVKEISFDDTPIFSISLAGPYSGFELRSFAEDIQDELEKITGVREVIISGGDEMEFEIAYDPEKLIFYNISAEQANQVVKAANIAFPAGTFEGVEFSYPVRTDAKFYDAEKLSNLPLMHSENGGLVLLKDVAKVEAKAIKKTVYSRFSSNGSAPQNSVNISIIKKTGGSIVDTADLVKSKINEMLLSMPAGLHYDTSLDSAELIKEDFNRLKHDFFLTLALVVGILILIIGFKEAFVAGLAVPLVFFATFGVMLLTGITLNFLSMFALILALGLLVDDAIVVVSATKQYLKTGKFTPEEAVLLVLNDFKVVLTTTTLTTVWAFLPLLSASGIIGEFIKSLPITISVTLVASLIIALLINHPLAAVLERIRLTKKLFFSYLILMLAVGAWLASQGKLWGYAVFAIILIIFVYLMRWYFKKGGKEKLQINWELKEKEWADDEMIKIKLRHIEENCEADWWQKIGHGVFNLNKILPVYEKYLCKLMATKKRRFATLSGVVIAFLLAVSLPVSGLLPSEFFPNADYDNLWVNIEAPAGTNLDVTDKIVKEVEEKLLAYKEIKSFSTLVGSSGVQDGFSSSSGSPGNRAQITITLVDAKQRNIKSYDWGDLLRKDLSGIKGADISVSWQSAGPPSGSAFEAQIKGDDLQTLDKIASDLKPLLTSIKGVVNADISIKASPADYTFKLDPAKLELYNLNAAYVGSVLRLAISGTEVTTILQDGKEIKVMATFDQNKIPNLESIGNLQIINLRNQSVFLKDVAEVKLEPSVDSIDRLDQKRTILLSAAVNSSNRPNEVLAEFQKKVSSEYDFPTGYEISYGGQNEQNTESVLSIIRAMAIAGLLIVSTLIVQFNSYKKALIVLATIPLALIGVFFGLTIARLSLSFPGLIGIVALFGIVVKNAIILVDKINLNLKSGIPFENAIIDAGKSRLEAIVITSICTIAGIIPITLSDETWMALGGAIIFGLMLSSFLTLFIVPVLFRTFVKETERF